MFLKTKIDPDAFCSVRTSQSRFFEYVLLLLEQANAVPQYLKMVNPDQRWTNIDYIPRGSVVQ